MYEIYIYIYIYIYISPPGNHIKWTDVGGDPARRWRDELMDMHLPLKYVRQIWIDNKVHLSPNCTSYFDDKLLVIDIDMLSSPDIIL